MSGITRLAATVLFFACLLYLVPTARAQLVPAPYQEWYVTSDSAGSHQTTTGVPAFGLDHDGIGDVTATVPGVGRFRMTGTLLPGGTSLVTAAHGLTDRSGSPVPGTAVTLTWTVNGQTITASSSAVTVHPDFTGNPTEGNDLAVVTFDSPIAAAVPRYDIYRGSGDLRLGGQQVKVGYGRSGLGASGDSLPAGTKRAGLNSSDADARAVLDALGDGSNPFGSALPPAGAGAAYDFDSGLAENDALQHLLGADYAHLGFGADEVGAAPGDSGGPTFLEANDTRLALSPGVDLGLVIVGAPLAADLVLHKAGNNATAYAVRYAGDTTSVDGAGSFGGSIPDFKITGVTSYGFGFASNPPDAVPYVTNASWGEIAVDTRVAHYQDFLDPFIEEGFRPMATQPVPVTIDTSSPGTKQVTVTVDNLAATAEFADSGCNDPDDSAAVGATVLAHADGSFAGDHDQNALLIDFAASPGEVVFDVFNLEGTPGYTAGLDLDTITGTGDTDVFSSDLAPFSGLAAGDARRYTASFDADAPGAYAATYTLALSDEDLPGAGPAGALTLTMTGEVLTASAPAPTVPEPAALPLLGALVLGLRRRRRR